MDSDSTEDPADAAYAGGFVTGLLTARYYAIRYSQSSTLFSSPVPTETPDIVYSLLTSICRAAIDESLFKKSWDSLDRLLLCESPQELQAALLVIPGSRLQ